MIEIINGFKYGLDYESRSEAKFAEEESNVVGFVIGLDAGEVSVGFRKSLSNFVAASESGFGGLDVLLLQVLEVEVVDDKSSGDDVILVKILDEGLDTGSLDELFLVDLSLDASGVSGDADDQKMGESVFLR